MSEKHQQKDIAVVGVSALFPGSNDAAGFWRDILVGKDLITDVPETHWLIEDYYDPNPRTPDKTYCKRGAFLKPTDFDPMEFGIPPAILPATDTSQLLALIVAQKVLEDAAQGQFADMDRDRMSVILGVTSAQELMEALGARLQRPIWVKALRETGIPEDEVQAACDRIAKHYVSWQESSFPGLLGNVIAGRIANRFDLRGTNCITDAACASSLSALSMGVNELRIGQSDMVIVGGVDASNDIFMYMCFSKTPALSLSGDCRPFAESADGTMLGEGLGMVALKRLEDAERDGDRVYAVIRGVGSSSDGRSKSVYAPVPEGQARALRRAYEHTGYGPSTVELVEAHGTGTFAGDAAEFEGLKQVFGRESSGRDENQWCALGTVKSQIGHTKAAAGAAGLFKAVMALHHKVFPPTIKIDRPNPKLEIEKSPFYLNTVARPWIRGSDHPRRASLSSFGFGGSNFHVTVEEYVPSGGKAKPAWLTRHSPTELVLLSAADGAALVAKCKTTAGEVEDLARTARSSQSAFQATDGARLAIVASDVADLKAKLEQAAATITKAPGQAFSTPTGIHYATGKAEGGVAFLFPGQGSQYVNMGADLAMTYDEARQAWDGAADLRFDGKGVHQVVFPLPVFTDADREAQTRQLTATEWAQPALGLTSLSMLNVLRAVGLKADCLAGHSFGEITALHAAGAIDASSLVRIARRRGELMRDAASTPGAMTAVSHEIEPLKKLLEEWKLDVVVANHNSPKQVVLSGSVAGIEQVEKKLEAAGIAAKRLPVATAFHSPLVAGSSDPFFQFLKDIEFGKPSIDVFSNAEVTPYPADAKSIRKRLAEQIAKPVRFVEQIEAMYARGVRTFVEVGPGSVLTDQVGRILGSRPHLAVSLDRKGKNGLTGLQEGLGKLSVGGVSMNLEALWSRYKPFEAGVVKKKPLMTVPIAGPNVGKPYPPPGGYKALPPPNPPRAQVAAVTAPVANGVSQSAPALASRPAAASSAPSNGVSAAPKASSTPASAANGASAPMAAAAPMASAAVSSAPGHAGASGGGMAVASAGSNAPSAAPVVRASAPVVAQAAPVVAPVAPRPSVSNGAFGHPVAAPVAAPQRAQMTVIPAGVPVHAAGVTEAQAGWMQVFQEGQRQLTAGHMTYQQAMADSHMAFMRAMESSFLDIGHMVGASVGAVVGAPMPAVLAQPAPAGMAAPVAYGHATHAPVMAQAPGWHGAPVSAPQPMNGVAQAPAVETRSVPVAPSQPAAPVHHTPAAPAAPAHAPAAPAHHEPAASAQHAPAAAPGSPALDSIQAAAAMPDIDINALMLQVVAEKTGYPVEMLEMHMELEADLGIDSIKRVEILSSIRDRLPGLPDVKASELAALRTLGQIVEYMDAQRASLGGAAKAGGASAPAAAGAPATAPAPAASGQAASAPAASDQAPAAPVDLAAAAASPDIDLNALMLQVVAEKTGYPVEMLGLHMELEADLGIDSIKRVEILSSIRDRVPNLPDVKAGELAALRTLGQIVEYMDAQRAALTGGAASATAATAAAGPAVSEDGGISRYVVREIDAPAVGLGLAGVTAGGRVVVTEDGNGVAAAVVEKLGARGVKAELVSTVPADASMVLFLGGLRNVGSIDEAVAVNREAFQAAKAVGQRFVSEGGVFVTVQDTGGDFGLGGREPLRAWLGGVSALARTAALEWPEASVKAIDLERGSHSAAVLADRLVDELFQGGATLEVGLHADGRRTTLQSVVEAAKPGEASPVSPKSVIVVSGGARGVTATSIVALAKAHQPRIVLLGRTALEDEPAATRGAADDAAIKRVLMQAAKDEGRTVTPAELGARSARILANREVQATLEALRQAGSEVRYVATDVQDAKAVSAALDQVRAEWGPITGLVHGAGILADKRIEEKTLEQFDKVFATKVSGLRALLDATANDPLTMMCLFSSIAARTGNIGQCDYAMANEVLNQVGCAERVRRGLVVRSIGWGPWAGGMVNPALRGHFEKMGVVLIPLEVGARMMVEDIDGAAADTVVLVGGGVGEGPLGASTSRSVALEVQVSQRSHGYLNGHRIAGAPVVPVVLVLEWFVRAARACRPDLTLHAVRGLKVLRGIKLEHFTGAGDRFTVHCSQVSNGEGAVLALELRGADDTLHYGATAEMSERPHPTPRPVAQPKLERSEIGEVYDGHVLFHRDGFQVIRSLAGLSKEGIVATVSGIREAAWSDEGWLTDAAALDGGLQLCILWIKQVLGWASLPLSVGAYHTYADVLPSEPLRCAVAVRQSNDLKASFDIALTRPNGDLVAELHGAELIQRPDQKPAHARAGEPAGH